MTMIRRKLRTLNHGLLVAAIAMAAPVGAVSLSKVDSVQPLPGSDMSAAALAAARGANSWTAGSASLVPLMAADMQANQSSTIDAAAAGGDAPAVGKPLDDIAFVRVATENGRKEADSARDALPRLKAPELKRIAELLVTDHDSANARLSQLAEVKQWPIPPPSAPTAPPAGSASSDFDARWTAEMIAGHERSVAMYRAQASGGEDKELRKYARDTLPTIEQHLTQLKSLQK
jgi:putative membrane protein